MWWIVWKDLRIEWRTKETLMPLLILGVLILLIFAFGLGPETLGAPDVAAGGLWVAVLFSSMLGLHRTILIEQENDCLQGLLLAPIDRGSIYLAKCTATALFMFGAGVVLSAVFMIFFRVGTPAALVQLPVILLLGTAGIAGIGTLFATVTARTRARELMLPALLLPLLVPVVLGAVALTTAVLEGRSLASSGQWLGLLATYDVLFVVAPWLLFDYVIVD